LGLIRPLDALLQVDVHGACARNVMRRMGKWWCATKPHRSALRLSHNSAFGQVIGRSGAIVACDGRSPRRPQSRFRRHLPGVPRSADVAAFAVWGEVPPPARAQPQYVSPGREQTEAPGLALAQAASRASRIARGEDFGRSNSQTRVPPDNETAVVPAPDPTPTPTHGRLHHLEHPGQLMGSASSAASRGDEVGREPWGPSYRSTSNEGLLGNPTWPYEQLARCQEARQVLVGDRRALKHLPGWLQSQTNDDLSEVER
jgi:hypothetical protein